MRKFLKATLILSLMLIILLSNIKTTLFAYSNNPTYACKAYCLVDYNSGKILSSFKEYEHFEVASMVKLMTCYIAIKKLEAGELKLTQKVVCSEFAASQEGSQAFLDAHNEYTIEELLKSIIIASANDSSVALAEAISGSEANFVQEMNKQAKLLNMENTLYSNSTGLPAFNQYSCAKDISLLLSKVALLDLYKQYSSRWIDELIHPSGRRTELVNTNRLIKYYPGCLAGKTGFTDEAGYCLSACASKNDLTLISVVMGCKTSEDRFITSSNLLNYGFANFKSVKLLDKSEELTVDFKGIKDGLKCSTTEDVSQVVNIANQNEANYKIELINNLKLPINEGDIIGKVLVLNNGIVENQIDLVSNYNYKNNSILDNAKEIFEQWFSQTKQKEY